MFLWATVLNGPLNSSELAQKALEHDMVLAPGNVFRTDGQSENSMCFNVANIGPQALALLGRILSGA